MRSFLGAAVLGLCVTAAMAADELKWKEFSHEAGSFTILMPGTPKQRMLDTESDFGKSVLHMNSIDVGDTTYLANFTDFPADIKKAPIKELFDSSRDGAVANMEGKLSSEKDIKLAEYPGREIRIAIDGGKKLFRARVYLVGQRLYQVVVAGTPESANSKDADKYLDSFKLSEK